MRLHKCKYEVEWLKTQLFRLSARLKAHNPEPLYQVGQKVKGWKGRGNDAQVMEFGIGLGTINLNVTIRRAYWNEVTASWWYDTDDANYPEHLLRR